MTRDEMLVAFRETLERSRQHVARTCGVPLVVTLEAMGYRLVPAGLVGSMAKVIAKAADATTEATSATSAEQERQR